MSANFDIELLGEIERKVLWLSSWMIHHANHIRRSGDGLKVGGHQASSASLVTIMTALYASILRPEDRVAVKPHAAPVFHALQYLFGKQSRQALENFRGFGGAQSYPSRTKDEDDVDISTGSVGLGAAQTIFASLVQDYVRARGWGKEASEGRMIALLGDAEMDEGNIFEALLEGWKQGLRNTWWIIDYNRQSLDAVAHEGLSERLKEIFHAFDWNVVELKYGELLRAAFDEPGGPDLRDWIDRCPNQLYSALTFKGGAAWRERLSADLAASSALQIVGRRSNDELSRLMTNLGGHDLPALLSAFSDVSNDRPVVFIAYTIKGFGLPLAGHKDNHAGLMTPAQITALRTAMNIREGREWEPFEGLSEQSDKARRFLRNAPFNAPVNRRHEAARVPVPARLQLSMQREMSTQQAFGLLLHRLAQSGEPLAKRIVTTSPDVTVSTNLGSWVNRQGIFSRKGLGDTFKSEKIPSPFAWEKSPSGQHIELGIAEMNLFLLLSAIGLSHSLFGERLIGVGTVYDPFIARGLDALNYACYQDARFIIVGTPSGISLAPEGGAHQSIGTPLIGMSQSGLASFEPAFADELAIIMRFAFQHLQEDDGGSVYLRLSTRSIEQPERTLTADLEDQVVRGGYWLREPGANCEVVIVYQGVVATEAVAAAGLIAEDRRDIGLLAVTSADRLHGEWSECQETRERGEHDRESHIERLLSRVPAHCRFVSVVDAHPATLSWIGGVKGHPVRALGVRSFGQTGTIADLYRHHRIDAHAILRAVQSIAPGRPVRHLRSA